MVHEVKDKNLFNRLKNFSKSPFFIPALFLLFLVVTIPVVTLMTSRQVDIRQRAATEGPSATINAEPQIGTVPPNQTFTADIVIDGGGQPFNAAQATVAVTGSVTVQSVLITPPEEGGCSFTFANQNSTPSVNNLSFAGAILNSSSSKCTVYTVTLLAGASGSGGITISNSQVKSALDSEEIFLSSQNGIFTISSTPTTPIAQSVLSFSPLTANIQNGQTLSVQVRIDTNGQTVNGIESDISYPANIFDVLSIDDTNSNFNVPAQEVIGNGTLSIAYGAITPQSGDILVTTINFRAKSAGVADVEFVNPSVVSNVSNTDVLKNFVNATYNVGSLPTTQPTPTQPQQPTPTQPQQPTPTQVIPTSTPVPPTSTPVVPTSTPVVPTSTPVPPTPTAIPNPPVSLSVTTTPDGTYRSNFILSGTRSTDATLIFVNNSSTGAVFPTATTWQFPVTLEAGDNTFSIYAQNSQGGKSSTATVAIRLHRTGDITGDDIIDLTDLSIFGSDWEKSNGLNSNLSDMNGDGTVNLTDFSIFARAYGN